MNIIVVTRMRVLLVGGSSLPCLHYADHVMQTINYMATARSGTYKTLYAMDYLTIIRHKIVEFGEKIGSVYTILDSDYSRMQIIVSRQKQQEHELDQEHTLVFFNLDSFYFSDTQTLHTFMVDVLELKCDVLCTSTRRVLDSTLYDMFDEIHAFKNTSPTILEPLASYVCQNHYCRTDTADIDKLVQLIARLNGKPSNTCVLWISENSANSANSANNQTDALNTALEKIKLDAQYLSLSKIIIKRR